MKEDVWNGKTQNKIEKEVEDKARELDISKKELAKKIDHTLLSQNTKRAEIEDLIDEAISYRFGAICINPCNVNFCASELEDTGVDVAVVAGFPLGQNTIEIKKREAEKIVAEGGDEIDMVMNVGAFLDGRYDYVKREISQVVKAAGGSIVKVILETGHLPDKGIVKACQLAEEAGADFVKTSTGFGPQGASVPHVWLMNKSTDLKVKAAGGIGNYGDAAKMVAAGADRIGASSGVNIVETFGEF